MVVNRQFATAGVCMHVSAFAMASFGSHVNWESNSLWFHVNSTAGIQASHEDLKYLTAFGLWMQLLCGTTMCFTLSNLMSHVLPCIFISEEQSAKIKGIGFISSGAADGTGSPMYYALTTTDDRFFPQLATDDAFSDDNIQEMLNKNGPTARAASVAIKLGQLVLNAAFMSLNVQNLPARDPTRPLNEAIHYVVFIELMGLTLYTLGVCYRIGQATRGRRAGEPFGAYAALIVDSVNKVAGWSAFHLLRFASPTELQKIYANQKEQITEFGKDGMQTFSATVRVLSMALVGLFGVAAMAVKLVQIDFVRTELWQVWTFAMWVKVAGFTANVVSIHNIVDVEKLAIMRFLVHDKERQLMAGNIAPIWTAYQRHLGKRIEEITDSPWKSLLVLATLSSADLKAVLAPSSPYVPELYYRILTMEPTEETMQKVQPMNRREVESRLTHAATYFEEYASLAGPRGTYKQVADSEQP